MAKEEEDPDFDATPAEVAVAPLERESSPEQPAGYRAGPSPVPEERPAAVAAGEDKGVRLSGGNTAPVGKRWNNSWNKTAWCNHGWQSSGRQDVKSNRTWQSSGRQDVKSTSWPAKAKKNTKVKKKRKGKGKRGSGSRLLHPKQCTCCAQWDHSKQDCPHRDKQCRACGAYGHIASACFRELREEQALAALQACPKSAATTSTNRLQGKAQGSQGRAAQEATPAAGASQPAAHLSARGRKCEREQPDQRRRSDSRKNMRREPTSSSRRVQSPTYSEYSSYSGYSSTSRKSSRKEPASSSKRGTSPTLSMRKAQVQMGTHKAERSSGPMRVEMRSREELHSPRNVNLETRHSNRQRRRRESSQSPARSHRVAKGEAETSAKVLGYDTASLENSVEFQRMLMQAIADRVADRMVADRR